MHILILPSWYPKSTTDVSGCFFREQAIALHRKGMKIGVITVNSISIRKCIDYISKEDMRSKYYIDEGVVTRQDAYINFFIRMPRLQEIIYVRKGLKAFHQYIATNGYPDIIHVHSILKAGLIAKAIYKKYKIPYVITEHSSGFSRGLFSKRQIKTMSDVLKLSKSNIAVSTIFAKKLETVFKFSQWEVIPNIVQRDFFRDVAIGRIRNGNFIFIDVCLLTENKRVDQLLRAFAKAFKDFSGFRLKIGGDGDELEKLKILVKELEIEKQVQFLGMLNREVVIDEIKNADVFVLSSEIETFGVVVIEALALGKPVVATRCGGPEDIIHEKNGILVPVNNVELLAEAMKTIYENIDNYDAGYIQNDCLERFGERAVTNQLLNIYNSIVSA